MVWLFYLLTCQASVFPSLKWHFMSVIFLKSSFSSTKVSFWVFWSEGSIWPNVIVPQSLRMPETVSRAPSLS